MRDLRAGLEQPNCSGPHAEEALTKSARCRLTAKKCRQSHTHKTLRELHCVGLLCIFTSGELLLFYRLHANTNISYAVLYCIHLQTYVQPVIKAYGGGGGGGRIVPAAHRLVIWCFVKLINNDVLIKKRRKDEYVVGGNLQIRQKIRTIFIVFFTGLC